MVENNEYGETEIITLLFPPDVKGLLDFQLNRRESGIKQVNHVNSTFSY